MDWNNFPHNDAASTSPSTIYGREMYETWYKMSVMLENGVDISPVITHRFKYDDYQSGFDAMLAGQTGKVILDWTSLA